MTTHPAVIVASVTIRTEATTTDEGVPAAESGRTHPPPGGLDSAAERTVPDRVMAHVVMRSCAVV
jgi:hypothetical protein